MQYSKTNNLDAHLLKGASISFLVQLGFAGLSFLNSVVMARLLGVDGFGAFANAMAWVAILPSAFGFDILIVREVAILVTRQDWPLLKGLLRFTNYFVVLFSLLIACIAFFAARSIFALPEQATMNFTLMAALPLIMLTALENLQSSALRGFGQILYATVPGMIIRPGMLLAAILTLHFFWPTYLNASSAMLLNGLVFAVNIAIDFFWLNKVLPNQAKSSTAAYQVNKWVLSALPLLVYGGMQIILGQVDIAMLGALRSSNEAGLYAVSSRLATLLGYTLFAAEMILAPTIAKMFANGEMEKLQLGLTRAIRAAFLLVLPIGLGFIIWGKPILAIFGPKFEGSYQMLVVLVFGRLAHVFLGSGAVVLSMTGHERTVALTVFIAGVMNILFNALVIPVYGLMGTALVSAGSLILMRLALSYLALRKTGLNCTFLGNISLLKQSTR